MKCERNFHWQIKENNEVTFHALLSHENLYINQESYYNKRLIVQKFLVYSHFNNWITMATKDVLFL